MIHVAAFSGGKDSTALLLHLKDRGLDYRAIFCDTGHEHPLTYAYVEEINQRLLGGRLKTIRSAQYTGMEDLVRRKGRVPSVRARFCTEELKVLPMAAYLKSLADEVTVYVGIRADESPARAAMPEREWSDLYDCWVERPLLRWSAAYCFTLIARHGLEANPLYRLGSKRVGCFPCVMTRHAELRRLSATLPEVWDRIAALEAASGRSFFPPDYIPARFCSLRDPKYGVVFPSAADVRHYVVEVDEAQLEMYGETPACLSVYNLCE